MTWERALEADARIAAKNAVLIRAALRQSFDAERAYEGYLNTTPDLTLGVTQQRARARAWAMLNLRINLEPLKEVMLKVWADGFQLGNLAAEETLIEARSQMKSNVQGVINWSKWKPGDSASAVWAKNPGMLRLLLQAQGITWKGFSDTTINDIGNAVGEAITLGLTAKQSAKLIRNHVASPSRALTIAITEQNRAISMATQQRYKDAGLEKMEWLVFEPCKICAQNADVVVEIGKPFPSNHLRPPAHPNCRCALGAVIPGYNDRPVTVNDQPIESAPTAGVITMPSVASTGGKVNARITSIQNWDKKDLLGFAAVPDPQLIQKKIWDGGAQAYITTVSRPNDPRLKKILEAQGFTAKPQLVDGTTIYQLGEKGDRMWRGVVPNDKLTAAEMIQQFKNGDMFVGTGVIGNGVYAGNDYSYVVKYAEDKAENVMSMAFLPGAKFVSADVAKREADKLSNAWWDKVHNRPSNLAASGYKDYIDSFGDITTMEAQQMAILFRDPGAWAALNGYDAIEYVEGKEKVFVILNRGAVAVEK